MKVTSAFGMTGGDGTLLHTGKGLTTMAAGAKRDTLLVLQMVAGTVPTTGTTELLYTKIWAGPFAQSVEPSTCLS